MDVPNVAVIGGSGFVGASMARYLQQGFRVRVIDVAPHPDPKWDFFQCDVRNAEALGSALEGMDIVIDTAIVQIPSINQEKKLGYEVNVLGVKNACEIVQRSTTIKGLILTSSWHVFGEREFHGVLDEGFGFRPDKIEARAKLYALCKIAQESIVRIFDEISETKTFGVVRLGTVLGKQMPAGTAANVFIKNAIEGKPLTPFRHTMYRPMLYVDVNDICRAFSNFARKIMEGRIPKGHSSAVVNVFWPKPVTIIELARFVKESVHELSGGRLSPVVKIENQHLPLLNTPNDKRTLRVSVKKAKSYLELGDLSDPRETIRRLVASRLGVRY
jgi:UDP-glucose 4-epimerase